MSDMEDNQPAAEAGAPAEVEAAEATSTRALARARWRDIAGRVAWSLCVTLALVLAAAAFSFALEANDNNDLVRLVRDLGDTFDLGFFDLDNPVKEFTGQNSLVKTALFNYGLASVVYLVIGRALERLLRP